MLAKEGGAPAITRGDGSEIRPYSTSMVRLSGSLPGSTLWSHGHHLRGMCV